MPENTERLTFPVWILTLCLSCLLTSPAGAAEPLKWSVTPYIWATDISGDLKVDGDPTGGVEIDFNDLLDTTDASFQIVVEAGRGRWSGFADVTYLKTSDSADIDILRIKTESTSWVVDMAAAFWPMGEEGGLNLFAGVRYTSLDDDFKFLLNGTQLDKIGNDRDFTDALVGARYRYPFAERWALSTRIDGSFGDSDGIFQLEALLRYTVGKRQKNGILFGYRYKEANFESGRLEEDFDYKGPLVGFNFRF